MKVNCKFCGKEISIPEYLGGENRSYSCGECTSCCMRKCKKNKTNILSWHSEPCKSCSENPYKKFNVSEVENETD